MTIHQMAAGAGTRLSPSQSRQPRSLQSGERAPAHWQRGRLEERQEEGLANFLGWFSIGLGLAEVLAPRGLARLIGAPDFHSLLPFLGVREIAAGLGIFSQRRPAGWVWARVAGDTMDLAVLGAAFASKNADPARLTMATAAVLGVTALDIVNGQQLSRLPAATAPTDADQGIHVRKAITVNRPAEELYRFWHNLENLPRFMRHLKSVKKLDGKRSHWEAYGPAGTTVSWDAETTEDRPNERIAWRSLENATVPNSGSVRFERAPGNRGTAVWVELRYEPPLGALGATLAQLFGGQEPGHQVQEDLRAFKAFLETGEIPTTRGQSSGRGRSTSGM